MWSGRDDACRFFPSPRTFYALMWQVAQRATITHLSPMCQGQISFKKNRNRPWKPEARNRTCLRFYACPVDDDSIKNEWTSMETQFGWLCWGLTSQSTIFQSCRDGAMASWVINQYFRGVKCLAQGHNTAAVGLEPRTSRSGVRHSTTEPPRSPRRHNFPNIDYGIFFRTQGQLTL